MVIVTVAAGRKILSSGHMHVLAGVGWGETWSVAAVAWRWLSVSGETYTSAPSDNSSGCGSEWWREPVLRVHARCMGYMPLVRVGLLSVAAAIPRGFQALGSTCFASLSPRAASPVCCTTCYPEHKILCILGCWEPCYYAGLNQCHATTALWVDMWGCQWSCKDVQMQELFIPRAR